MQFLRQMTLHFLLPALAAAAFVHVSYGAVTEPAPYNAAEHAMQVIERFEERFAVMDSLIFPSAGSQCSIEDTFPQTRQTKAECRSEVIDEVTNAQIAAMKANTGLELRGQAYARPGRQISYDPDDPLVAYNAKLQVELNWDIFNSSVYKRRAKTDELRLKGELRQLDAEREVREQESYALGNAMRSRHYGHLMSLLKIHAENLQLLMETQIYLLQNGKISSDDLVKVINEQSETERRLVVLGADTSVHELPVSPAVISVSVADTTALFDSIGAQHRNLRRFALQQELLDAQRRNTDYAQTMYVTPFVRWSYYNRYMARNTYNIDVGVSFRLPLAAEASRKRQALTAQKNAVAYEQQHSAGVIMRDVRELLQEIENNNRNMCGEFARMKSLKDYLAMRIESYRNVAGDYSRVDRLLEYNAYLQAWERLLGYAYQRDCLLIELQEYLPDESVSDFLIFEELN